MSKLTERLQNSKQNNSQVMYSETGAKFQEWAISILDSKNSIAHKSIGKFVTAINNNQMTVGAAEDAYIALLSK